MANQEGFFVTSEEVISFVKAMISEPSISNLFYRVGKEGEFLPQEAVVISGFLEKWRRDRAAKSLPPDYGFLSSGLVIMRMIVSGEVTGPDDPRVAEFLGKVLKKGR